MQTYLRHNEEKIYNLAINLENFFLETKKLINLDSKWNSENYIPIEVKKSFLRAVLRDNKHSFDALENIIKIFKISKFYNNRIKFFTKIYPMIHLPKDRSEAVGYHFDKIGNKKFYTVWCPVTNYNYPALSYVKFSQYFPKILSSIFIKTRCSKLFCSQIDVEKGDVLTWNGNMLHQGNLNVSESISVAFQLKFTEEKFYHENSYEIDKVNFENFYKILSIKDVQIIFKKYQEIINYCLNNQEFNKKLLFDNFKEVNKSSEFNNTISFALSVLAQRIFTFSKNKNLILNLDYLSILFGGENLSSINRIKFFLGQEAVDAIKRDTSLSFLNNRLSFI